MGYSIAYISGSTVPFGTYKQGNILMGLKPQEYTVSSGFTWYANATTPNENYLIISDTYSQGWSTQQESKPTIWRSETGTTESFVSLVNQLPDVNGVTGFTDSGTAMKYLMDSGKYFVNKDDYLGIVSDGLVLNLDAGWYPSYPGSGTTWKNLKGINNGIFINGPTFNSGNGGSVNFDGTDEIVSINISNANHLKIENFLFSNHTIEVWFKLTTLTPSLTDNTEVIQALITWPGFHNGIFIQRSTPTSTVYLTTNYLWNSNRSTAFNTNTPLTGSNSNIITTNTWFCIHDIIDYSSTKCFTYVNGVNINTRNEVPTSSMTSSSGTPPNVINIGAARNTSTFRWLVQNGNCGSVRLYNRALSADEVLQNYNATKGRFGL
jgi:hypothetical protein